MDEVHRHHDRFMAIMKLICIVVVDPESTRKFCHSLDPVQKLFALLLTPIKPELKGAIFEAIATIVRHHPPSADETWALLERLELLPIKKSAGADLRQNLEQVEAVIGRFPTTAGFLTLLDSLLQYGEPFRLGIGKRRPGILSLILSLSLILALILSLSNSLKASLYILNTFLMKSF